MEEGEASAETRRLRTDLTTMIGRMELSLKEILLLCPLMIAIFLTPCSLQNVKKVSKQRRRHLKEMALVLEENKSLQASVDDLQACLLQERHRREDLEVKVLALEVERR